MHDLDRRLAPTFASQLALITRRQVLAAGGTPSAIKRRVSSGRWEAAERGVYALAGVAWTWRRLLAAVVLSVPSSAASHRAAAKVLGAHWDDRAVPPIELCVPSSRNLRHDFHRTRERSPGIEIVVHEGIDLTRTVPRIVDGFPTTAPLRLAVDLGAVVPFDQYRRAMSQLMKIHGIDWVALDRTYRRHSAQGRDGCGALRDLLERHYGNEGVPDEVVEARCADLLVDAGLPTPVHQYSVIRPDGSVARFDLAYPDLKIAIETDGRGHGEEPTRNSDNRRRNDAQLLGWDVFHFSWEEVNYEPERVVSTIRAAIAAATPGISQ